MKPLVMLVLLTFGCEHDPRFEKHHDDTRPEPAAVVQPVPAPTPPPVVNKTIERPALVPKPLNRRIHHRHH